MAESTDEGRLAMTENSVPCSSRSPRGQPGTSELQRSCHTRVAAPVNGFRYWASANVTVWKNTGLAVAIRLPGGSVQMFCPTSHDEPPVNVSRACARRLPDETGPPAARHTSENEVTVTMSS